MGLAGINQSRQMFVGQATDAITGISDLANANDIVILSASGKTAVSGDDIAVFVKDALGNVTSSGAIKNSQITDVRVVPFEAKTLKAYAISGLTVDSNSLYTVNITISQHGSLSSEDDYVKQAFYQAGSSDTDLSIIQGLVANLNANFSKEVGANASSNPYLSFVSSGSAGSAVLTITEKEDWLVNYDPNKKSRHTLDFTVDISSTTYPTVGNTVSQSPGKGTGYQIQEMEFYLLGARGDTYREGGYPHNIVGPGLVSTSDGSYNVVEISYWNEGRDEAKKSKQAITLAFLDDDTAGGSNADVNTSVIAPLVTALGVSLDNLTVA
jgi:hypothetical protein